MGGLPTHPAAYKAFDAGSSSSIDVTCHKTVDLTGPVTRALRRGRCNQAGSITSTHDNAMLDRCAAVIRAAGGSLPEERRIGMGGAAARQTLHLASKSEDRLFVMGAANGLKTCGQTCGRQTGGQRSGGLAR